ncbi:MAG TPA: hypothetical protein VIO32_03220 [Candidatus Baltobacteraceae bacterium]
MLLSLPRREPNLDIDRTDSRVIVHDRTHDYVHIMDERALAVLEQCDGAHTYHDITRAVSSNTHEPYEQVAGEVAHLVAAFADLALVESAASKT